MKCQYCKQEYNLVTEGFWKGKSFTKHLDDFPKHPDNAAKEVGKALAAIAKERVR